MPETFLCDSCGSTLLGQSIEGVVQVEPLDGPQIARRFEAQEETLREWERDAAEWKRLYLASLAELEGLRESLGHMTPEDVSPH